MTEHEYYKLEYTGPPIKFALLDTEDITDIINKIYGENYNWNGKLYTASVLSESIIQNIFGKSLYIEFDDYNPNFPNSKTFIKILLEKENTIINPPMHIPFSRPKKQ